MIVLVTSDSVLAASRTELAHYPFDGNIVNRASKHKLLDVAGKVSFSLLTAGPGLDARSGSIRLETMNDRVSLVTDELPVRENDILELRIIFRIDEPLQDGPDLPLITLHEVLDRHEPMVLLSHYHQHFSRYLTQRKWHELVIVFYNSSILLTLDERILGKVDRAPIPAGVILEHEIVVSNLFGYIDDISLAFHTQDSPSTQLTEINGIQANAPQTAKVLTQDVDLISVQEVVSDKPLAEANITSTNVYNETPGHTRYVKISVGQQTESAIHIDDDDLDEPQSGRRATAESAFPEQVLGAGPESVIGVETQNALAARHDHEKQQESPATNDTNKTKPQGNNVAKDAQAPLKKNAVEKPENQSLPTAQSPVSSTLPLLDDSQRDVELQIELAARHDREKQQESPTTNDTNDTKPQGNNVAKDTQAPLKKNAVEKPENQSLPTAQSPVSSTLPLLDDSQRDVELQIELAARHDREKQQESPTTNDTNDTKPQGNNAAKDAQAPLKKNAVEKPENQSLPTVQSSVSSTRPLLLDELQQPERDSPIQSLPASQQRQPVELATPDNDRLSNSVSPEQATMDDTESNLTVAGRVDVAPPTNSTESNGSSPDNSEDSKPTERGPSSSVSSDPGVMREDSEAAQASMQPQTPTYTSDRSRSGMPKLIVDRTIENYQHSNVNLDADYSVVSWFQLDQDSYDSRSNAAPARLHAGAFLDDSFFHWPQDSAGAAIRFDRFGDALSSKISAVSVLRPSGTDSISIEAMIFAEQWSLNGTTATRLLGLVSEPGIELSLVSEGDFLTVQAGSFRTNSDHTIKNALQTGMWHHVKLTLAQDDWELQINGQRVVDGHIPGDGLNYWSVERNIDIIAGGYRGWIDDLVVRSDFGQSLVTLP